MDCVCISFSWYKIVFTECMDFPINNTRKIERNSMSLAHSRSVMTRLCNRAVPKHQAHKAEQKYMKY